MPYINVDEAYILDNTGLQVDMTTDIPFADAGFSDTQKEQARKNIGAGSTNPNLLDNWYFVGGGSQLGDGVFPINQRGLTYYESGSATYLDRWKSDSPWESPVKCALQSEGMVLAGNVTPSYPDSYAQLTQVLSTPPVGKTVTLSILVDTVGNDSEGSPPVLLTNGSTWTPITLGLTTVTFTWSSGVNSISIITPNGASTAASLRIQAIKLEVGTVSTLANDAPPNFLKTKQKCQERLWIDTFGANSVIAGGVTFGTSTVFDIILPVSMANTVTMIFSVTPYIVYNDNLVLCDSATTYLQRMNGNHYRMQIGHNGDTNIGVNHHADLLLGSETVVTASCEL